jgi:hypothetical protein
MWGVSMVRLSLVLCLLVVCGTTRPAFPQADEVLLRVEGVIARPLTLNPAAWAQLPHTTVQAREREGTTAAYAGVLLRDILAMAGAPFGAYARS